MTAPTAPHPHALDTRYDCARERRRAGLEAFIIAVACMATVCAGVVGVSISADAAIRANYQHYLTGLARAAAQLIDGDVHRRLDDPAQIDGPEYVEEMTPLRRFRDAIPDVKYVYTLVLDDGDVRFVVDAEEQGDRDRDGMEDRSGLWELYEDPTAAMLIALGKDGVPAAAATDEPYSDRWGVLMSGHAPFFDAEGRPVGAVGVDVDAQRYVARLANARNEAFLGLLPALGLITTLSFIFFRIRLRGLVSTREVEQAGIEARRFAEVLAQERQRLSNVIEGTDAGTWDWNIESDEVRVNDRWASMLGRRAGELGPVTASVVMGMIHPDDVGATNAALTDALKHSRGLHEFEFRMRHADGHWVWISSRGSFIEHASDGRPIRMAGTHLDVTARKEVERALMDSESRFRGLFELSPVGIALRDWRTGRLLEANEALLAPTGYSREEFLALDAQDVMPEDHAFAVQAQADGEGSACTLRYGPYESEHRRADGTTFPVLVSGMRMTDAVGRDLTWSIVQDISSRKAMESELKAAAQRDRLTGLANRALFMEQLQHAIGRVRHGSTEHFAVLFLDFDNFKRLNDTLGHAAGDELLKHIAGRLHCTLRTCRSGRDDIEGDVIARFGGDEFVVLLNDIRTGADAARVSERLLDSLASAYNIAGREVHSTASIGIVTSDQCMDSAEAIIRNADVAMYEAKRRGRACSVLFNETMHTRLTRQVAVEDGLRKALDTDQLYLVFQPIVDLRTGRMVSAEALTRWTHPELGSILPAEFIPIAEESGLIVQLGDRVLLESCRRLVEWQQRAPDRAPGTVSVNISRVELGLGPQLLTRVREILDETGLRPECLQLEITEREVMRDPHATRTLLRELRGIGVRLAMDDFGTGTSSLACLREYPFDTIKIDRAFVGDLADSHNVLAVIHATIALVENLGMAAVAEGVEEPSQAAILETLGCHYAQGYFFSRPVPADRLLDALTPRTDSANAAAG
jgi:diguanylate cyclase (GGDEF)-like protein/PAS domain S-box-containing protein